MTRTPEDLDSERSLLATLASPGALDPGNSSAECQKAVLSMRPAMFIHPTHRLVCEAIQGIYKANAEVNVLSLKAWLESKGKLDFAGGFTALVELVQNGEDVLYPMVLVDRLENLWRSREVMRLGAEAHRRGQDSMEPIGSVLSDIATQLSALSAGSTGIEIRSGGLIIDRLMSGEAFRDPNGGAKLVNFGVPCMDEVVEAAQGHVITLGARPGVGKSAEAIQGLWETALSGGRPFLVSLEMDKHEIDSRLASWVTGSGYSVFRSGHWKASDVEAMMGVQAAAERIQTWCHPSGVPWSKVEAAIRDAVRVHGCTSVWIDHVLLIAKPVGSKGANDAACWSELSRGIKRLAQELGICIVNLIQLNRQGADGEPRLQDLKESGAWEEDANAVWMLWNKDAMAAETQQESKSVWVKSAKNRSGASGWKRELNFQGAINRFTEVTHETAPFSGPCSNSFV